MTVLLDDHLLRDWMARRDDALVEVLSGEPVATTNLWYPARLTTLGAEAVAAALAMNGRVLVLGSRRRPRLSRML